MSDIYLVNIKVPKHDCNHLALPSSFRPPMQRPNQAEFYFALRFFLLYISPNQSQCLF